MAGHAGYEAAPPVHRRCCGHVDNDEAKSKHGRMIVEARNGELKMRQRPWPSPYVSITALHQRTSCPTGGHAGDRIHRSAQSEVPWQGANLKLMLPRCRMAATVRKIDSRSSTGMPTRSMAYTVRCSDGRMYGPSTHLLKK
jgi:hypothetical protein